MLQFRALETHGALCHFVQSRTRVQSQNEDVYREVRDKMVTEKIVAKVFPVTIPVTHDNVVHLLSEL